MVAVPWWIFLLLAPVAYGLIAYGVPAVIAPRSAALIGPVLVRVFAPFIAFLTLLVGVLLALHQRRARKLLDQQAGLESIRSLRWNEFERLVGEVFRRRGYSVVETGGGGADGGIDLTVTKDGRYLVQCKHWKAFTVGVKEVRELFGIVTAEGAAGGILVTSGRFTEEAKAFARGKTIEMMDGRMLLELVRDVQNAKSTPAVADGGTAGEENRPFHGRRCPRCGHDMVVRTARQGEGAGRQFWGCSRFPRCRATAAITD